MEPKQQHFGLGQANSADLTIVWPNGQTQVVKGLAANQLHTLEQ